MTALALLSALGFACVAVSARLLDDRAPVEKPEGKSGTQAPGPSWGDALIFLLCLAGILYKRKRVADDED